MNSKSFGDLFPKIEKWPVSNIKTRSPGESVFTMAASQPPDPRCGVQTTAPLV